MDLFTDNVALITRAAGVIRLRRLTRRRLTAGLAVGGRSGGRWQSPVSGEDSGTFLFLSLSLSLARRCHGGCPCLSSADDHVGDHKLPQGTAAGAVSHCPLPCLFPSLPPSLPSWLRHCLCLMFYISFAAKTLPLRCPLPFTANTLPFIAFKLALWFRHYVCLVCRLPLRQ